ncbi:uncharacterized protein EI90DRAFT_963602 [Cantharellus anzutake]|uniref:uncharacterized protein n=1 Tax=Cantharellus anzutake TaxID=1750568 RepID=UPI001908377E|nr:uncharacterized protein EI90DRAFT_963602 [Cantharellus anzutake]KAF8331733.1 hypothetical protein EI90DRAFT_963602 [Cantharellus anzutake]
MLASLFYLSVALCVGLTTVQIRSGCVQKHSNRYLLFRNPPASNERLQLASVSSQEIHTVVYPTDNRHFACNTTKVRFVKYQTVDKWISVSFDVPAAGDTNVCEMVSVDNRMGNMGRYGLNYRNSYIWAVEFKVDMTCTLQRCRCYSTVDACYMRHAQQGAVRGCGIWQSSVT